MSGSFGVPGFGDGAYTGSSFTEMLRRHRPDLLPETRLSGADLASLGPQIEATTVLAIRWGSGVVMAGDRRATEGSQISQRRIRKVFPADEFSAVAIAGVAGMAMELVRLFQTELEYYEKAEGISLSLDGKANHLAQMVRNHLPLAMQGLAVVPLFCGYEPRTGEGGIYQYDVVGGRYQEAGYHATGSGGGPARAYLKRRADPAMTLDAAVRLAVAALGEAADEDSGTGGVDEEREIYPVVAVVDEERYRELADEDVAAAWQAVKDEVLG